MPKSGKFLYILLMAEERATYHDDPRQPDREKRQTLKILALGFLALAAITGITYAASININTGGSLEFGQAVIVTSACSGSDYITLTPNTEFDTSTAQYKLSNVVFSHVPDSCLGDRLALSAFSNLTTLELDSGVNEINISYSGTMTSLLGSGISCARDLRASITNASVTSGYGTFTLSLNGVRPLSTDVTKLTIITSKFSPELPVCAGG